MQKIEKSLLVVLLIGMVLRFFNIGGGSVVMVFSASFLSFFYCIFTFAVVGNWKATQLFNKASYSEFSVLRFLGLIALGFGFSFWLVGLMFHIQNWLGGVHYLFIGGILMVSIGIGAFIKLRSVKDRFYYAVLIRIAGWLLIGITAFLGFSAEA